MSRRTRATVRVGAILASHEVTQQGKPVGYLYREKPEDALDSGWRVLSGEEDQSYADDPGNFSLYNASTIVRMDPDIAQLLSRAYPVAFERDLRTGEFVEIEDDDAIEDIEDSCS